MDNGTTTLAAAAVAYASNGYPVFPLLPGSKIPRTKHGLHAADTDIETVAQHWDTHPNDNIGLRPAHDMIVLDVESMAGHGVNGYATLAALTAELGRLPDTAPIAVTPTGGLHIWLSHDVDRRIRGCTLQLVGSLGPGIDVKSHNGYLVAPPSRIKGLPLPYRWWVAL